MMSLVVDYIDKLADKNPDTYFVGIDGYRFYMTSNIKEKYPDRVIGAGISEQNAISIATGLALSGKIVYVFMIAAYATRRALDQFKFACYCNAKIRVITTLSGLSHPFAGFSHTAIDDVTIMKNSPHIKIYNPSTNEEMQRVMELAETYDGPMYIADDSFGPTYSKVLSVDDDLALSYKGKGDKLCILYAGLAGYFLHNKANIIKKLRACGTKPEVYSVFCLEPIDREKIIRIISKYKNVVTFEIRGEGSLSSSIAEIIASEGLKINFLPIRLKNENLDIMGYYDFVADKYLKINTLDEKIIDFVYKKRGLIFNKKISGFGMDEFKIVYRLLFIPFYTIVKTKNTVKHLLFGIIKIKEARL